MVGSFWLQVGVRECLGWVGSLVRVVFEAELDELSGLLGDLAVVWAARRELWLFCGEDQPLFIDLLLRDSVAEGLAAEEQLVEDDSR